MANREVCKYGDKCYQKNPFHMAMFKHPPKQQNAAGQLDATNTDANSSKKAYDNSKRTVTPAIDRTHLRRLKRSSDKHESGTESNSNNVDVKKKFQATKKKIGTVKHSVPTNSKAVPPKNTNESNPHEEIFLRYKNEHEFIRSKFLVDMPFDFYLFWDFCKTKCDNPMPMFEKFGVSLIGPFDVLAGDFVDFTPSDESDYLRHHRFFYDPPQFQSLFLKINSEIHMGYWRDSLDKDKPVLLARNDPNEGCEIKLVADNIFSGLLWFMDKLGCDPFNMATLMILVKEMRGYCNSHGIPLNTFTTALKTRKNQVVCNTFHNAGLVVPVDRKTEVGYRPLVESYGAIKKIVNSLELFDHNDEVVVKVLTELQPVVSATIIAVDECDFGTPIELGINLFCTGRPELHALVLRLLSSGFSMLNQNAFKQIIQAHLAERVKGNELSILPIK